ncbi:hypothetical protein HDU92_007609, partial [Lobulomyces angularis]
MSVPLVNDTDTFTNDTLLLETEQNYGFLHYTYGQDTVLLIIDSAMLLLALHNFYMSLQTFKSRKSNNKSKYLYLSHTTTWVLFSLCAWLCDVLLLSQPDLLSNPWFSYVFWADVWNCLNTLGIFLYELVTIESQKLLLPILEVVLGISLIFFVGYDIKTLKNIKNSENRFFTDNKGKKVNIKDALIKIFGFLILWLLLCIGAGLLGSIINFGNGEWFLFVEDEATNNHIYYILLEFSCILSTMQFSLFFYFTEQLTTIIKFRYSKTETMNISGSEDSDSNYADCSYDSK